MGSRGTQDSAEKAAVDPTVAGIATAESAEAVAMQEAEEYYRDSRFVSVLCPWKN